MTTAEKLYDEALDLAEKQEFEKAFTLYSGSAELGYAPAQINLAMAYLNGKGTQQNDQAAVAWLQKAVAQNHPVAISNLGYCYSQGRGVAVDKQRALALYKQAADLGNEMGSKNYQSLYTDLYGTAPASTPTYSAPPTAPQQPAAPQAPFAPQPPVSQYAPAAPMQNLYTPQDVANILQRYKAPWLPKLCARLNGVFIAALIFFAFRDFDGYPEVILSLFVPGIVIFFLISAFYPFHHRKKFYKKNGLDNAIRCDSGNMQIAIKVYNAHPTNKTLDYIKMLNPAAGQLISYQLSTRK